MSQVSELVHPILGAVWSANGAVAGVAEVDPMFMRDEDQVTALHEVLALEARTAELKARLLTALDRAGRVDEGAGERDLGFWLAHQARAGIRDARREIGFAHALEAHPVTGSALRAGTISAAQATVVMEAVEALPADLPAGLVADLQALDRGGADVAARAEARLVADAAQFGPAQLRVLGRRILEVVAPEIADEAEARKLEAAERRGRARIRLTVRRVGDGTSMISGRLPDLAANHLLPMLDSLVNPRRTPAWAAPGEPGDGSAGEGAEAGDRSIAPKPWWAMPAPYKLGHAFVELLSRIPTDLLPVHGSTPATLFITATLEQLRTGLGAAIVQGPRGEDLISVAEARRLACTSNLIPAVLGTGGEVLDLGRTTRLFTAAQVKALRLRYRHCQGQGCTRPASHCEAHHHRSWLDGGPTDLANAVLLCNRCHHRAHDPRLTYEVMPEGAVVFTARGSPP
ncbi:HNH endonuclease signature motif containing protein [Nocardioides sp.]|uniref:HNH endonuclease signature motif containing protein n=1 Tax=Nocardioides sp. TaxID=35761 RepID=UPI002612FCED|nr:HNH endonuclease signature motif containing protein [Nocardioides sp.]